ncbi:MAG: Dabb family protein [Desulfococcaceae bacterium]
MIRHIVLMTFKGDADPARTEEMERLLGALPSSIPEIRFYEFGRDVVRSERSCDFGLVSAFDDMAAMKRYQEHPDHQNALTVIREVCSDIRAVDYAVESGDA